MSAVALARPEIRGLERYRAAAQRPGSVRLNANEAPRPLDAAGPALNRYPELRPAGLARGLAAHYGVRTEQVLVTRGSSEAIDLLIRTFCAPGTDGIVIPAPTFGMYRVYADIQGAQTAAVPLAAADGFAFDVEALLDASTAETKLVFLCSPNNPTGGLIPQASIRTLCAARRGRSLIVVDEAYIEFAGTRSMAGALDELDNLVVLRTLSKALALAGARCGALLAHPEVIRLLDAVLPPYALATPVVDCVLAALAPAALERARAAIAATIAERERMHRALAGLAAVETVWPSAANFLLVRFRDPAAASAALARRGVLVRELGPEAVLSGCARISVGTPDENDMLLAALAAED